MRQLEIRNPRTQTPLKLVIYSGFENQNQLLSKIERYTNLKKDSFRLKEHDTEGEDLLKSFADVIHTIRQAGYEVVIGKELKGENYIPSITAKAYVPEWNLILTTSSQNISTILNTFAQRNKRVCVIHGQKNENVPSKVLAYLVQRKKFFFDTYEFVVEENFKRATEACKQFILQCKSKNKTQSMDRGEKA